MGFLCGRGGRLAVLFGVLWPGQSESEPCSRPETPPADSLQQQVDDTRHEIQYLVLSKMLRFNAQLLSPSSRRAAEGGGSPGSGRPYSKRQCSTPGKRAAACSPLSTARRANAPGGGLCLGFSAAEVESPYQDGLGLEVRKAPRCL